MSRVSLKASRFRESVIREMTRLADRYDAINLAQGFPDFPAPEALKEAACRAIRNDLNQYAVTWGAPGFRKAIATHAREVYGWEVDPDTEVTVACGATECMIASLLALVDPGDQVVVFEPFYENYGPDAIIAGARPLFVPLTSDSEWTFDPERLEETVRGAAQRGRVRGLVLNNPNNPTGRVFSSTELEVIARLAREYDLYVFSDEIYEHIVYEGLRHRPIALLPGMKDRTITISGLTKTFSVTGWRVGYIIAPSDLTGAIRKMHDFLTVGAPAPLQEAGIHALSSGEDYYGKLRCDYQGRRDYLTAVLREVGFRIWKPSGAYYVLADIRPLSPLDDVRFVEELIRRFQVAAVPGSSFFSRPEKGRTLIRFAFCKTLDTLKTAGQKLLRLRREPISES